MCFDIEKQRMLGILDAEYNQCNKRIGCDCMNHALEQKKIAEEQFAIQIVLPQIKLFKNGWY